MIYKTYFFVPANKQRFLEKSESLPGISNRVLDFEDSVSEKKIHEAIQNVSEAKSYSTDWIRIPVNGNKIEKFSPLFEKGLNKIVLPKISGYEEFKKIILKLDSINPQIQVILLIENALLYLEIEKILKEWGEKIIGLGLGSHDFCSTTQMLHESTALLPLRLQLSLIAKAYNLEAIDIASMNISDQKEFQKELLEGFNLGYRSKFILHPKQISFLNEFAFFSKAQVQNAEQVLNKFDLLEKENEDVVLTFKGEIFEKPHLKNLKEIVNWGKKYYGANR